MKINLKNYGLEFGYWVAGLQEFIDTSSLPSLSGLREQLESGRDNLRPSFRWKLPAPIWTKSANRYDGRNSTPHKVRVGWQFECEFVSVAETRKSSIWLIKNMVTHIRVHTADDRAEILHFHFDLKNGDQLGPHAHMQLSEDFLRDGNRVPIAVPRFPSAAMLPTDCLDLILSEFFPFEWPKSQSRMVGLAVLQNRQKNRMLNLAAAVSRDWAGSRKTPIAATQDCYYPDLQIA